MPISDLVEAITQIRDALNDMEVKGPENAARMIFIRDQCNALIEAFHEIVKKAKEEAAAEQTKANESVKEETEEVCHESDQRVS